MLCSLDEVVINVSGCNRVVGGPHVNFRIHYTLLKAPGLSRQHTIVRSNCTLQQGGQFVVHKVERHTFNSFELKPYYTS